MQTFAHGLLSGKLIFSMARQTGANQVLSTHINIALQCGDPPGPGNTAVLTAFWLDWDCGKKTVSTSKMRE
jgi:hypothetical protein